MVAKVRFELTMSIVSGWHLYQIGVFAMVPLRGIEPLFLGLEHPHAPCQRVEVDVRF